MNPTYCFICLGLILSAVPPASAQRSADPYTSMPQAPSPQAPPTTPPPASPQTEPPKASGTPQSSDSQLKTEEKQRLLGIVPEFNTVQSGVAVPLRPSQKFSLWFHSATDPFTFFIAAADAGIEQAQNTYPAYHQGFEGYAKRFGAAYADNVDGNFWGNAVLPTLLHQDPRYFRLGHGSFKHRLGYAALSTVRAKGDNGKWEPNYSNLGGNLIGGAISNLYIPSDDRGVGQVFETGLTVTAEGALGAFAYEFYPDAIGYLQRRHQRKVAAQASRDTQATTR